MPATQVSKNGRMAPSMDERQWTYPSSTTDRTRSIRRRGLRSLRKTSPIRVQDPKLHVAGRAQQRPRRAAVAVGRLVVGPAGVRDRVHVHVLLAETPRACWVDASGGGLPSIAGTGRGVEGETHP